MEKTKLSEHQVVDQENKGKRSDEGCPQAVQWTGAHVLPEDDPWLIHRCHHGPRQVRLILLPSAILNGSWH
jgi:hypothetical protein